MSSVSFELKGTSALKKTLETLAGNVENNAKTIAKAGADVLTEAVRENIRGNGLIDTGDMYNATVTQETATGAQTITDVVYAAVHEYGLPNQPITDRQRRFFWAMFMSERNPMWRALALSKTYTIPARPYFRPALDTKRAAIAAAMGAITARLLRR